MKKFEVLKLVTGIKEVSMLIFDIASQAKSEKEIEKFLNEELTEEQLQTVKSVAESGNYPLSLEELQ